MKRSIFITTLICGVILMGLNATTAQAFEVLTEEDFVQNNHSLSAFNASHSCHCQISNSKICNELKLN